MKHLEDTGCLWLQNDADEDVDDIVKCSEPTAPAVFRWTGEEQEVFLAGSFDNWSSRIRMVKRLILMINTYLVMNISQLKSFMCL